MRLFEIYQSLFEDFKLAQKEFAQASTEQKAKEYIQTFRELLPKIKGQERDINFWRKQGWNKFKQFVDLQKVVPSRNQVKKRRDVGKSITLLEKPPYLVVIPLDHEASCYHGKNTDWCTTKPNQGHFSEFFYNEENTFIYVLNTETGDKNAIGYIPGDPDSIELRGFEDNDITPAQFKYNTTFDPDQLIELANKKQKNINAGRNKSRKTDLWNLLNVATEKGRPNKRLEKLMLAKKDAVALMAYAVHVFREPWPEAEPIIKKDPVAAREYKRIFRR